jgi:hypothetical protein
VTTVHLRGGEPRHITGDRPGLAGPGRLPWRAADAKENDVKYGFNRPALPSILSELDGVEPIDRSSINALEDEPWSMAA